MGKSPLQALLARPRRFKFDAAVRLLWLAARTDDPNDAIRFNSPPSLAHPVAEVESAEAAAGAVPRLTSGMIGLAGPSGTLPRWYTELVAQSLRARAPAMARFLDLLAQRLIGHFARAGAKYRLHRAAETALATNNPLPDPMGMVLLSLTGHGSDHLTSRLPAGIEALQHYSGFFATWPRSADRLAALASDWLGRPVALLEFAGLWLPIPPDQRSALPRRHGSESFNRLGRDCAAGVRAFDPQARFILRVGPLSRSAFEALLPDRPALGRFVSLIRAYVGMEVDFAVNLVLDPAEIPPLRLGGPDAPRLGWTAWLPAPSAKLVGPKPADQALFSASLVESRTR